MSLNLFPLMPLLLSACSVLGAHRSPPSPPLLSPVSLGHSVSALQIVRGSYGNQEANFQSIVKVDSRALTVIGLSAQGQRLFTLRYDGENLQAESTELAPIELDLPRVLVDLQLALWPLDALQRSFDGTLWEVSEPAPQTRRLRRHGKLIAEVHYQGTDPWQGMLWLSNFESDYSLVIESGPLQ